jgi:hypothetical protein
MYLKALLFLNILAKQRETDKTCLENAIMRLRIMLAKVFWTTIRSKDCTQVFVTVTLHISFSHFLIARMHMRCKPCGTKRTRAMALESYAETPSSARSS